MNGHEKSGNGCIAVIPELENHNHFTQRSVHEKEKHFNGVGDTLPRTNASGNLVLTSHARIDNRDELFRNLNVPHSERAKMPDSTLILMAYQKWGQECSEHLIGDWCFGIWDKGRQTLFLARDHHGNTGIYYYQNARFFAFSSSIKGLLALPDVPRQLNPLRIAHCF